MPRRLAAMRLSQVGLYMCPTFAAEEYAYPVRACSQPAVLSSGCFALYFYRYTPLCSAYIFLFDIYREWVKTSLRIGRDVGIGISGSAVACFVTKSEASMVENSEIESACALSWQALKRSSHSRSPDAYFCCACDSFLGL
jgi:hypothetical protein